MVVGSYMILENLTVSWFWDVREILQNFILKNR